MIRFRSSEEEFILSNSLSDLDFYDGQGMTISKYKPLAKKDYCHFVVADKSVCGHRLKTRNGHCIQCRPERIAMQAGGDEKAYVYAAYAPDVGLWKIGRSVNTATRANRLNENLYGNSSLWEIRREIEISLPGRLEAAVQKNLAKFRWKGVQEKDGQLLWALELFKCQESDVREAFNKAYDDLLEEFSNEI